MPESNIHSPFWLLALESSTSHGGVALLRDGLAIADARLEEGLRHGRELMPAAAGLLERTGVTPRQLLAVAVSTGPGSYTGTRVGVMSAKSLAYGAGCRLTGVSSLAALAFSLKLAAAAGEGDWVMVVQDARRDEVYAGLYQITDDGVLAAGPDAAIAPEEARNRLASLAAKGIKPKLAGSGFSTYKDIFGGSVDFSVPPSIVEPAAVGLLGWRQILREEYADPFLLQPEYLRRDAGADWSRDLLITNAQA